MYDLPVTLKLKPRHFSREEFRAEILSLACHVRGELLPVRLHDAGIIHDLCRDGDLTADLFLFKDKNAETSTCQINSGGESCRTSADYYGIVGFNFCQDAISPLKLADQVERGLEGLFTRLPLGRADLVTVLVHELSGLDLAEEFISVAADVAGAHFVKHHFAFRIDHEGAAFSLTRVLNVDIEFLRETAGRVTDHRVLNLADTLGGFVPGLVNEVRVTRNGVDLSADLLEFSVLVLQILEFGRADKGEVSRIEEEDAPLTLQVLIGHIDKLTVLVSLQSKFADFLSIKRHG